MAETEMQRMKRMKGVAARDPARTRTYEKEEKRSALQGDGRFLSLTIIEERQILLKKCRISLHSWRDTGGDDAVALGGREEGSVRGKPCRSDLPHRTLWVIPCRSVEENSTPRGKSLHILTFLSF